MRHRFVSIAICAVLMACLTPAVGQADSITRSISGFCDLGEFVSFQFTIDFTATGGDFEAGTGTANVAFTLENTTGLVPFQVPAFGNSDLTRFRFNAPEGSTVAFMDATVLAGSYIVSRGVDIGGEFVPAGCRQLLVDEVHSNWYDMDNSGVDGGMEFFRNTFETEDSKDGGLVDPEVVVNCVEQGDFFPGLVIAGRLRFTAVFSGLNDGFTSAADFLGLCSVSPEDQELEAFSGKFQDVGDDNLPNRCRPKDLGNCTVPVEETTWGVIKALYGGDGE